MIQRSLSAAPDRIEQGFHFHCKRYWMVSPVAITILPEEISTDAMILDELDEVASGCTVAGQLEVLEEFIPERRMNRMFITVLTCSSIINWSYSRLGLFGLVRPFPELNY